MAKIPTEELEQLKTDVRLYGLRLIHGLIETAASLQDPLSDEDWPEDSHSRPDPELQSIRERLAKLEAMADREESYA